MIYCYPNDTSLDQDASFEPSAINHQPSTSDQAFDLWKCARNKERDRRIVVFKAGVGCYIGSNFVDALANADVIGLIAPTATALHNLLIMCHDYAHDNSISFNPVKTKCLVVPADVALYSKSCSNECFTLAINQLSLSTHSAISVN